MFKKLTLGCLSILLSANLAYAVNEPHEVKVLESINSGAYTYLKVEEKGEQYWAAIMKTPIKVGSSITIKEQVWMKNFKSKTLDKTFDKILFAMYPKKAISGVDNIHSIHGDMINKKQKQAMKPNPKFNEKVVVAKGSAIKTNISEIFSNKDKFKNKNVEIQGEVLQVSNKVMGNTWVKIYDGKEAVIFRSPNEDEKIVVGNKVKVVGTINTNVDYGFGYAYEVIGVNGKFEVIN